MRRHHPLHNPLKISQIIASPLSPALNTTSTSTDTSPSPSTTSTPRCPLGPGFPQSWVRALMLQKGGSSRLLRLRECAAQFYPLRGEKCQDSRTQVVVRLHSRTVPASNSLGPAKVAVHSLGRPLPSLGGSRDAREGRHADLYVWPGIGSSALPTAARGPSHDPRIPVGESLARIYGRLGPPHPPLEADLAR